MAAMNIHPGGIYFHNTAIQGASQISLTKNSNNRNQADGHMVMALSHTAGNVTVVIFTTTDHAMTTNPDQRNTQYASLGSTPPVNDYPAFNTSIDNYLGHSSYIRIIGPTTVSITHLRPIRKWGTTFAPNAPPHMLKDSWRSFRTLFSVLNAPQPYKDFPEETTRFESDDASGNGRQRRHGTRIRTRSKQRKHISTSDTKSNKTYATVAQVQLTEEMLEEEQNYIDILRENPDASWMMNKFFEQMPW